MPSQRCAAKAKSTGKQCARFAIMGGTTCRVHGSGSAKAKAAAARRVEEDAARAAMVTLGLPVDVSPSDALLEEVRWTAGHVQWLRRQVQELEQSVIVSGPGSKDAARCHPLTWGTTKQVDKQSSENPGTDTTESAGPSIWYELYDRERKHLVTVCTAALRAGVEERRVRLAEAQGEQVAGAIRAILADLGLSADQQAKVSEVVPRHLRLLAGGSSG